MINQRCKQALPYLSCSKNSEGFDDLFGGIAVGRLASHEVEESVERHATGTVRIHQRQNSLQLHITLQG